MTERLAGPLPRKRSFDALSQHTTGLLVTYIGPDSYELSRLLAAIREIPRPADPAP